MPLDAKHCNKYVENAYKQNLTEPYRLAYYYYYIAKDYKKTLKYINKSLEYFKTHQSDDDKDWQGAINYLTGNLYYHGYEYPQDYQKALEYFQKPVNTYDFFVDMANIKTAYIYKNALGVKRDLNKAKQIIDNYKLWQYDDILMDESEKEYDEMYYYRDKKPSLVLKSLWQIIDSAINGVFPDKETVKFWGAGADFNKIDPDNCMKHLYNQYRDTEAYKQETSQHDTYCKKHNINQDECQKQKAESDKITYTNLQILYIMFGASFYNDNPVTAVYENEDQTIVTIETKYNTKIDIAVKKGKDGWIIEGIANPQDNIFKYMDCINTTGKECLSNLIRSIYGPDAIYDIGFYGNKIKEMEQAMGNISF